MTNRLSCYYPGYLLGWQQLKPRVCGAPGPALQHRYGKSIAVCAPGRFVDLLPRKAARAGGSRTVIDVRRLRNSQYDHATGAFRKKALAERWHPFGDGRGRVQRDIYLPPPTP